jgi:4-diphosphocytidyl-2-C-methyl-D-erythritol kinase
MSVMIMDTLKLLAPAKINYVLDVLGKRSDNYHELRMVMQRIALSDEIEISRREGSSIRVFCGQDGVPDGAENIAWRAANALLEKAQLQVGLDITIVKNIPVAAGLGGGSSDAATVLMGLNQLLDLRYSDDSLMSVGVTLGADVPFFIFKKTALAEGIGERLTAVDGLPPVWLVLVNPNIHVSTAWVYQNLQLTNRSGIDKLPKFCGSVTELSSLLSNDLEAVTIGQFPVIQEIKDMLRGYGAQGVLMSGSGPTVFAIFESETQAKFCHDKIAVKAEWYSVITHTI